MFRSIMRLNLALTLFLFGESSQLEIMKKLENKRKTNLDAKAVQ
jgi:hypothetical protein